MAFNRIGGAVFVSPGQSAIQRSLAEADGCFSMFCGSVSEAHEEFDEPVKKTIPMES
jgi:hypothetical protein